MPILLPAYLLVLSVIRIVIGNLFPITADEAYYWLWSKHLAMSYVDHPPIVAYINYFFTLGRENLFMLRFGAVIFSLLVSVAIYYLAKELVNEKIAFLSAIVFQLVPHFFVIWLTMFVDLPMVLCWTIAIYLLDKIRQNANSKLWYLLGIVVGIGSLSKYTMFLFWPSLLFYFLIDKEARSLLKEKALYLAGIISLLLFLPVLIWNSQHNFISFAFHAARTSEPFGQNFLPFVGDQLVHYTPFLIIVYLMSIGFAMNKNWKTRMLLSFSIIPLSIFLLLSFKAKIWPHWPSLAYITAIPLTLEYLDEKKRSIKIYVSSIFIFLLLIVGVLLFVSPGILLHQKEYAGNNSIILPQGIQVYAQTAGASSILEFYSKQPIYLANGFLRTAPVIWGEKQYDLWNYPNLVIGESVIFFGSDSTDNRKIMSERFTKVTVLDPKLFLSESYMNTYKMFRLDGFKSTGSHP